MRTIAEEEAKVRIAKRIAKEFTDEDNYTFLNCGVGVPTTVPDYIRSKYVVIHAENGMLGVGPLAGPDNTDPQLINASRQPVCETPGCSFFDSSLSFGMIRGGHVDATILGALEVDKQGNIANWIVPNGRQLGVGGAMDLVSGANRVIIAMTHCTKKGQVKLRGRCQMPITAFGEADLVVTEYAVFTFREGRMMLSELAPELTLEELAGITEAHYMVDPDLREYQLN